MINNICHKIYSSFLNFEFYNFPFDIKICENKFLEFTQ